MKFGVRECADMVFKTTDKRVIGSKEFDKYQPVFHIDTARTSTMEQATTTVYAQGGRGYNRLISWEGEKTMTFTVEDALISPMGLAILTGAGLINNFDEKNMTHFHLTMDVPLNAAGKTEVSLQDLQDETGLTTETKFLICNHEDAPIFATVLDGSGYGYDFKSDVTVSGGAAPEGVYSAVLVDADNAATFTVPGTASKTVRLDFYLLMASGVTEVTIKPEDFGGFFYVEAATLFRREDTGADMVAALTFPKVKVQSGFSFTMAGSGDPSTFTFTMDAFPGYTKFDHTKKVMCQIQMLGSDDQDGKKAKEHNLEQHYTVAD